VILLYAALSMGLKDFLATMLTVAEARGRAVLAGTCDALGDLANIGVVLCGAGQIIEHGLDRRSWEVLAVITCVSFAGTLTWTKLATRWMPDR
jgi:hypothetical protein